MSNFKEASKQKLRFQTNRGLLSVEQLWDLPVEELDSLAATLDDEHKESGKKSYIPKRKSVKDKTVKLRFDIVLEILSTKVEEQESLRDAADVKAHNEKIDALIADKKEDALKDLSVEELEKLRK